MDNRRCLNMWYGSDVCSIFDMPCSGDKECLFYIPNMRYREDM